MVKASLGASLDPRGLLTVRLVIASSLLTAIVAIVQPAALRLPRRAWVLTGVLGVVIAVLQFLYYLTVQATDVGTAVFLEYLAPAWVVLVSWGTGRLAFERWSAAAVVVALGGSLALVVGGDGLRVSPAALAFGLGAGASLASQNLLLERTQELADRLPVFVYSTLAAAVTSLALGDVRALWTLAWTGQTAFAIGYMVVLATLVPMLLFMYGVRRLGAAKASLVVTLEPVVAAAGAAALLGDRMGAVRWGGGGLIVLAIALMYRAPARPVAVAT